MSEALGQQSTHALSSFSSCVSLFALELEPFRAPVDWQGLGLFDYPQVVRMPMDLGTIKKKLSEKKYANLFQAADDVRLVWSNCMTYNADGSDFFVLAQNLKKEWERRFSKLLQDHSVTAAPTTATSGAAAGGVVGGGPDAGAGGNADAGAPKISLEDKRNFARSLYKISKEDLGKLLVEVDNKCQTALVRNNAEDEFELNVDKIPPGIFLDLVNFVKQCSSSADKKSAPGANSGSKKKSAGGASSNTKRQKS